MDGRHESERVVGMNRNEWSPSVGISSRFERNTHIETPYWDEYDQIYLKLGPKTVMLMPGVPKFGEVMAALREELSPALKGEEEPKGALQEAERVVNSILGVEK